MPKLILPPIPRSPMYVDGVMIVEWQDFFRNLYVRVGGFETADSGDILNAIASGMFNVPTDYNKELRKLKFEIASMVSPKSYDHEIKELRTKIEILPSPKDYDSLIDRLEKAIVAEVYKPRPDTGGKSQAIIHGSGYGHASDNTERATTGIAYAWENNLDVSIDVEVGDLVMVILDGWFKNASDEISSGYIQVFGAGATRLTDIAYYRTQSRYYDSKHVTELYEVTIGGTIHFRMIWKSHGGGTVYADNRIMKAWVIGKK